METGPSIYLIEMGSSIRMVAIVLDAEPLHYFYLRYDDGGLIAKGELKMAQIPNCPKCNSEYTYEDGNLFVCPECAYEWTPATDEEAIEQKVYKDANGNVLQDGDTVTVIKDLKVKGSSSVVKVGTKVKNIRLVDGDHDIECKIDGFGAMQLKTEFVKKV